MASENTVKLKIVGDVVQQEALANDAITPGMLLQLQSDGTVRKHSVAGQTAATIFAIEDELQGRGIDTDYANASLVQYVHFRRGDRVNALLANGETIIIGDYLVSASGGLLQKRTLNSAGEEDIKNIVGVAKEAVDLSGSSGADPSRRIDVEII